MGKDPAFHRGDWYINKIYRIFDGSLVEIKRSELFKTGLWIEWRLRWDK